MTDKFASDSMTNQSAGLVAGAAAEHGARINHRYHVECWRSGVLVWEDTFDNLVTTVGKNKYVDSTLKTGSGGTPAWYVGLVTGPGASNTYAAADTMSSHAGWSESTAYSEGTRQAFTAGTVASGSVDNTASKAVFSINGTATIGGCFLVDNSAKGGTTGTLLGVGNFAAGDRSVLNGDSLNVSCTLTIS